MARIKRVKRRRSNNHASPHKAHQERVLCLSVYEIAASSTSVYANLKTAREIVANQESPFWEPIENAWSAAVFVDRLFAAVRYLARQTSVSTILTREAYRIHDIIQILGDRRLIDIFHPYIEHIDNKNDDVIPPEAAFKELDSLEFGDDE